MAGSHNLEPKSMPIRTADDLFQPISEPPTGMQFQEPPHSWGRFPEPVGNSALSWPVRFRITAPDFTSDIYIKKLAQIKNIFVGL